MLEFLYGNISYLGIVVVLALTGIGLPIPEEFVVVVAGWASANGQLDPWFALAACICGALLGDCIVYAIGYHFGHSLLVEHRRLARFLKADREARVEQMIMHHGLKVFVVARFLVGLRTSVYLATGVLRVPFRKFIVIDAICATLVIGLFFGLSYRYAQHIDNLLKWIRGAETTLTVLVVAVILSAITWYWLRRRRRWARVENRRRRQRAAASAAARLAESRPVVSGGKPHDAPTP